MICRENPQKPWVLRGPAEGKYAWMVYGIERRKENEEDLSARVTVYTDILSTEMFLEILDYFRSMCSGDIVLYLNGWLAMPAEISRRNEQEAKKRNINFFSCIKSLEKSEATASGFSFACKMKKIKFAVRIFIFSANSRV